jgi:hypothetical protein
MKLGIPLLPVVVLVILAGTTIYRRYTGLKLWQSAMLCLLAVGLGIALAAYADNPFHYGTVPRDRSDAEPFVICCAILLPLLTVPFAVRLYRKWIGGHLTEAEKLPGIDGVRAWLGVGNIICAALIPICLWQVFGYSPFAIAALTFGLLLAYPLLNMASQSAQPAPVAPTEDLSSEREKVLQLLEAGKVSAVESAELLNALGHSPPPPPKPAAEINPQRKMVLLGAALLLVGFFLPWFTINTGEEMNRAFSQMQQNMDQQMPNMPMNGNMPMNFSQINSTVRVSGGNIGHGLGWWILLLGIGAAVLPFFATTLEAALQKKIILAALGIGAILLIYLLSNTFRYVSFGILLVLAGYVLELVGTLKERPLPR